MEGASDLAAFSAAYEAGVVQLLTRSLVGDCETPVAAFLKLRHATQGPAFLLESVEGGAVRGRYSMIGLEPDLIWRCHHGQASLCRPALGEAFLPDPRPAFESLRALLAESAIPDAPETGCRRWPPAFSAISATTWSG